MARFRQFACDACGEEQPEGSPLVGWSATFTLAGCAGDVGTDREKLLVRVDFCKECAAKAADAVLALLFVKDWNEPTRTWLAKVARP